MKGKKHAMRQAKQIFRLCLVNGLLDEDRTRHVVQQVIASGYRECPAILAEFVRLVRLHRDQHTARIESAVPLPGDLRASIRGDLNRRYGEGVLISFEHRPALIGGIRIQVGSDVFDGSVLAGLTALENSF